MKDHLMLNVSNLPESVEATEAAMNLPSGGVSLPPLSTTHTLLSVRESMGAEEEPLIQTVECRICQEEDNISNLESPCACTGSLKYAHRACVQRWCDEKGDLTCEICHEPYKHGGMIIYCMFFLMRLSSSSLVYSGGWTITGTAFDLRDPRIIAMAQNHIMEADYDDYSVTNASSAAFCRSAALILMALLVLRHVLVLTDEDEDDASSIFFYYESPGFCYHSTSWLGQSISYKAEGGGRLGYHKHSNGQVAAALAATEVAFILQSGQRRGMNFTIAPDSPATPQHEPIP
uniref:RING-CH-type domain-containing protein n=1 Tax=Oryza barthii TaxID=65489 RepID=A0A0D3H0M2_9ORYZ